MGETNTHGGVASEFDEEYDDEPTLRSTRKLSAFVFSEPLGAVPRRKTLVVPTTSTIAQTIAAMNESHVGVALCEREGKLAGIFTERDVLTKVAGRDIDLSRPVESVMTHGPETLPASASIGFALAKMTMQGYRHVPLVDNAGSPAGVVAVRDIVAWLVEFLPEGMLDALREPGFPTEVDGG